VFKQSKGCPVVHGHTYKSRKKERNKQTKKKQRKKRKKENKDRQKEKRKKGRKKERKEEREQNLNFCNISHSTQKSFVLYFTHRPYNVSVCKLKFLNDGNNVLSLTVLTLLLM